NISKIDFKCYFCERFYNCIFFFMKKSYQSLEVNSTKNMKQVIHRKFSQKLLPLSFLFLFLISIVSVAQEGDPTNGKALFNANCASCHKLDKKMTGPALRGVEARLEAEGLDRQWIYD